MCSHCCSKACLHPSLLDLLHKVSGGPSAVSEIAEIRRICRQAQHAYTRQHDTAFAPCVLSYTAVKAFKCFTSRPGRKAHKHAHGQFEGCLRRAAASWPSACCLTASSHHGESHPVQARQCSPNTCKEPGGPLSITVPGHYEAGCKHSTECSQPHETGHTTARTWNA